MARKLSAKAQQFAVEYIVDLNATQAAIRAGYSPRRASEIGYQLLQDQRVLDLIEAQQAQRCERTKIDADYVLQRLVEIDQMDVLDIMNDDMSLKPVRLWPKVWRQYLSGFDVSELFEGSGKEREMIGLLKKVKWPDKVKNLELLGKHVDIMAFRERVDVNVNVSLADRMAAARERARSRT